MSYTNVELVKKHLMQIERTLSDVNGHQVVFADSDSVELPHSAISKDSEIVKGVEQTAPFSEAVTFDEDEKALSKSHILSDSVVVSSDSSLGRIFTENVDYTIDYESGSIVRISTGGIEADAEVTVWYFAYTIYDRNADYAISCENGILTRIAEGRIESGQIVYIDYSIEAGVFTDETISRAIGEASVQMSLLVDDGKAETASPSLSVAETYLAVAILTQIRALEAVQSPSLTSSARSSVSSALLQLSNRYREEFQQMIKPNLRHQASLAGPYRS